MTAGTATLGLLPLLVLQLHGTEIERPLAVVMIGGLVTSTLFTLLVLPTFYLQVHGWLERRSHGAGEAPAWVCRGTFNLDIGEIAAGGFPHVTSTQVFTFDSGGTLVSEGPEGGATVTRAVIGGTARFGSARGEVVEKPLGVNTSNLFNVRFYFDLN